MFSRIRSSETLLRDSAHSVLVQVEEAVGTVARAALWPGKSFRTPAQGGWPTGFAGLDAELPGGGWPGWGLIEILQDEAGGAMPALPAHPRGDQPAGALAQRLIQRWTLAAAAAPDSGAPGIPGGPAAPGAEWRLLLPMLARLPGGVTLIGPPAVPHAAALAQAGLALDDLVWVQADTPARRLWAAEQVLRAGLDGATLVWLPWASAMQLRRLQMAALASPGRVFVMRPASAAAQSSPAPLRLLLRSPRHDTLAVRVFKRRGPPAERDVELTAWPPGLEAIVAGQGWMTRRLREGWSPSRPQVRREQPPAQRPSSVPDPAATPFGAARPAEVSAVQPQEPFHVVAGLASA